MTLKKYFKKFAALGLAVSMLASVTACSGNSDKTTPEVELEEDVNVNLWYSDDRYTGYFEECARRYHESNAHVTVMLNLVEDENYLDDVYNSCIKSDDGADIFMMSSDDVQKAYLMGLMSANTLYPETFNEDVYGRAAIAASTYSGRLLGYPLTFETSVMVYNKKFATPFKTFEEITGFSDNFQHTDENEAVTQIIGWDVSDVSLNYAFLGEYMNVGGDNADDVTKTYLQDDNIKAAAQAYLQFKDSYGIVRDNPKYSDYIRKFTEGSLLYTIVNTSDLSSIAASGIDYGIMQIPDYNSTLKTRAMSKTYMLAVTPYASNSRIAASVARMFTYDYADELISLSSMPAARGDIPDHPEQYNALHSVYAGTALKARYMEAGDYYLKHEKMLHQIWDKTASVDDAYIQFKDYVTTTMNLTNKTQTAK